MKFKSRNPKYEHLRKKWVALHREKTQNLFDKHLRYIAAGSLGGLMLLSTPGLSLPASQIIAQEQRAITKATSNNILLVTELKDKLPSEIRPLNKDEDRQVTELIAKDLKIKVTTSLEGKRLNTNYGLIGGEQHLYRYPGDNLYMHAKNAQDWAMFSDAGIAPGLGAWGYFANSKQEFTDLDEEKERWYIAVQTFLSSGYAENVKEFSEFFKYRKMLVINPKTGQAVVTDIADAGPSPYTGKHLGGSPEVMHALGLATGPRKGEVLFFFIVDPENKIPLGPIKVNEGGNLATL